VANRGITGLPRKVLSNIGWKVLSVGLEKGLKLGLVAMAARLLGHAIYGRFNYAAALSYMLVQVTDLGLQLFLAREIARATPGGTKVAPRVDPDLMGSALSLKAVLAVLYLGVMATVAVFHRDEWDVALTLMLMGLASLAASTVELFDHVFRGIQRLKYEVRLNGMHALLHLCLGAAALHFTSTVTGYHRPTDPTHPGAPWMMLMFACATAAGSLLCALYGWTLVRQFVKPRFGLSREVMRRFARDVLPLGFAILASMVYYKADVPMLRSFKGDHETGLYTAAYKILENLNVIPAVAMAALFPAISRAVVTDRKEAARLHGIALKWLALAGGSSMIVLLVAPWLILRLLFGTDYLDAEPILRLLGPAALLTCVNYLETHMLVALGLVRIQMVVSIVLIVFNVGANLYAIPRWGAQGAAFTTILTEIALLCACVPLVRHGIRHRRPLEGAT